MMRRWALIGVFVVAAALVVGGCTRQDMRADMVRFDRAYIPALALTNQGQAAAAGRAMPVLVQQWQGFSAKYAGVLANAGDRAALDEVGQRIAMADVLVRGGSLAEAHEQLEGIRMVLLQVRRRHHIDYFVDRLTEFHHPMEAMVQTAKAATPATLSAEQIATLSTELAAASGIWQGVAQAEFDRALFGFSEQKAAQLQQKIAEETAALAQLRQALDAGDKPQIIRSAMAIKPVYAETYMMFGDFVPAAQ